MDDAKSIGGRIVLDEKKVFPQIYSMANIGDKHIFKPLLSDGTYIMDEGNHRLRAVPELNKPYSWHPYIYSDCVAFEDKVLFVPYQDAEYISVLDTSKQKFQYIENPGKCRYKKGIPYKNQIYIFGERLDGGNTLVVDMEKMTAEKVTWNGDETKPEIIINNISLMDDKVYCPNYGVGSIAVYHLPEKRAELVDLKRDDFLILTIAGHENLFWLSGIGDGPCETILIWNSEENSVVEEINLQSVDKQCPWNIRFSSSIIMDEYVYFAPIRYDRMIRINRRNGSVESLFEIKDSEVCWSMCRLDEKRVYVSITDYETGNARNCICSSDGSVRENAPEYSISSVFLPEKMNLERDYSTLEMFLKYVNEN